MLSVVNRSLLMLVRPSTSCYSCATAAAHNLVEGSSSTATPNEQQKAKRSGKKAKKLKSLLLSGQSPNTFGNLVKMTSIKQAIVTRQSDNQVMQAQSKQLASSGKHGRRSAGNTFGTLSSPGTVRAAEQSLSKWELIQRAHRMGKKNRAPKSKRGHKSINERIFDQTQSASVDDNELASFVEYFRNQREESGESLVDVCKRIRCKPMLLEKFESAQMSHKQMTQFRPKLEKWLRAQRGPSSHRENVELAAEISDENEATEHTKGMKARPPMWYAQQCKNLSEQGHLDAALAMFERRMLKLDQVQPIRYNFDVLLGALAREGYAKKAFSLFRMMTERYQLKPSNAIISHLLNACANDNTNHELSAKSVTELLSYANTINFELTRLHWNSAIFVFGRARNDELLFDTLNQMIELGHLPDVETFNALLKSCGCDHRNGFAKALQVHNAMEHLSCTPSSNTVSAWMYICRFCHVRNLDEAQRFGENLAEILQKVIAKRGIKLDQKEKSKQQLSNAIRIFNQLSSRDHRSLPEPEAPQWEKSILSETGPRLGLTDENSYTPITYWVDQFETMAAENSIDSNSTGRQVRSFVPHRQPVLDAVSDTTLLTSVFGIPDSVSVDHLNTQLLSASGRFRLVFGEGVKGFTQVLYKHRITPTLQFITQAGGMMSCTLDSIHQLLKLAKKHQIRVDTAFFNVLIRRKTHFGRDYHGALEVLDMMLPHAVTPDVYTISALAPTARTHAHAQELVNLMRNLELRPNIFVYDAFLRVPLVMRDFVWANWVLELMIADKIRPSRATALIVQKFSMKYQEYIANAEARGHGDSEKLMRQREAYRVFMLRFTTARESRPNTMVISDQSELKTVKPKTLKERAWKQNTRSLEKSVQAVDDDLLAEPDRDC